MSCKNLNFFTLSINIGLALPSCGIFMLHAVKFETFCKRFKNDVSNMN